MGNGMSNFTDFISGGGSASFPTIFLHKSQTWVPPQDGNIMIHVIGAGGSGSGSYNLTELQSGGAGGYCRKDSLAVTTSGSFTVVIGAGGAFQDGSRGNGANGGTTTVSGTGLGATLTATGGAGGTLSSTAFTNGGVGSNGDFNTTGGRGGHDKGGGAVGLLGTGNDGTTSNAELNGLGGDCDIVGDFYSSSLGQISGSLGSATAVLDVTYDNAIGDAKAGPLAGAGAMYTEQPYSPLTCHATIGGGGGWGCSTIGSSYIRSGRGGEGCVVIQYIP
jgi:hypothetical protein